MHFGFRLALTDTAATIGRASSCSAISDDPDVVERHVTLRLQNGAPTFEAQANAQVFVDGQPRLQGNLKPGEQLRIGRSLWQIARAENNAGGFANFLGHLGGRIVRGDQKFEWTMLQDARFLRAFGVAVAMHTIWDSPLRLPLHLKYITLGFVVWVALLNYIQSGLRQVRAAQASGATEFFKKQREMLV